MWDPVWEDIFASQEWGKYPGEELIRFVARGYYRAPNRRDVRFLELGCGPGANLWFLAREGFAFCGVDGSPTAVERAARRLDAESPGWREHSSLHVGDIGELPFGEGHFDAVIDIEALSCNDYESARAIYAEAARVTRSGGRLFSRTFAEGSWGDGTGEPAGRDAWRCAEGPLMGKGMCRFTRLGDIAELIAPYRAETIEILSASYDGRTNVVKEWLISATRP